MFKFFNANNRKLRKLQKEVIKIKREHALYENLTDDEIKDAFNELESPSLETVFAIVKEATKRTLGFITHDVQLIGGIALAEGNISEMRTGEGKTLVAVAPAIYKSFYGNVHIITVNDYLARRDAETMMPIFNFLGIDVGIVTSETIDKKEQYLKKILYVTNTEIAFDYLRDNLAMTKEQQVLPSFDFALIDEVDSVLIDEARSPLIVSGVVEGKDLGIYAQANEIALRLEKGKEIKNKKGEIESTEGHFIVDQKHKQVHLTEDGIDYVEKLLEMENMYDSDESVVFAHALNQAISAINCYEKDVDYIVKDNNVYIIDENTGRVSEGRRFSEGLHQAIEAKEGLEPKPENQTVASITYQNFFKKYKVLSGMTGTAQTEATEFSEIYNLDVVTIPTNKPSNRKDYRDLVYMTEDEKIEAIVKKVKELKDQPVLIGTASIEKSELISKHLEKAGIAHEVLNAKNHEREAEIISKAGELGSVTIATNMAGRGVDIKIPQESLDVGGLFILGSERHPSRRIDNQLRGRSGRQGDVGASQFFLSLDDDLLVKFGGDRIQSLSKILKIGRGEAIESGMLTKTIENSQKQIENLHFEYRKNVIKYDDVNNEQRKVIYDIRQSILDGEFDIESKTHEYIDFVGDIVLSNIEERAGYDTDLEKAMIIELFKDRYSANVADFINAKFDDFEERKDEVIPLVMRSLIEQKRADIDIPKDELFSVFKMILLQILDAEWKEHLHQLDVLSTGIGLRQYNQKDPTIEYKKEAFHMFENLISRIKEKFVDHINRIVIAKREEPQETPVQRDPLDSPFVSKA